MAKKKERAVFDESAYLQAMSQGHSYNKVPVEKEEVTELPKEPPAVVAAPVRERKKVIDPNSYEAIFLSGYTTFTERNFIGIRPELYKQLGVVISRIGGGLSLQGYIDNILRHHIETYRDDINRVNKEIIKKDIL